MKMVQLVLVMMLSLGSLSYAGARVLHYYEAKFGAWSNQMYGAMLAVLMTILIAAFGIPKLFIEILY